MGALNWIFGRHEPRPPNADHVVELAWVPLWKAQLTLHHLWECGIPATMSEDHSSQLRFGAREPMARLFVIETRLAAAKAELAVLEALPDPDPTNDEDVELEAAEEIDD